MEEIVGGFIVFSIIFCPLFGWKGLVAALLMSWLMRSSKQPESEPAESKQPVSAEKDESSRKDDLAMSIIAATCGDQ